MSTVLLSPVELEAMSARIGANADRWLAGKLKTKRPELLKLIRRKPRVIVNPFAGYLMKPDDYKRPYPLFAMDIIEGIARLDWHGRGISQGGVSKPLSVRKILSILEWLPEVTTEAVERFLDLGERHASRYVKAVKLAIPRMMDSRPNALRWEMEGVLPPPGGALMWEDLDELRKPSDAELAQLHHDMRTLTEFKTEAEYGVAVEGVFIPTVLTFPARKQHAKKAEVMDMLSQGESLKSIGRCTGVSLSTIRKWRDEGQLQAA
ncbi:helix-turn-helix domain-containing protein [Pseudomonas pharyngis]|uniref:helix-turn-helix domain-containing protein n=1 Tax=Pseudomonas pharyngis TaxID=2892333 RepID=UPI001F33BEEA|nr:helix-turn-helix domain-containing protein [Pseudomonas pharyngis]